MDLNDKRFIFYFDKHTKCKITFFVYVFRTIDNTLLLHDYIYKSQYGTVQQTASGQLSPAPSHCACVTKKVTRHTWIRIARE